MLRASSTASRLTASRRSAVGSSRRAPRAAPAAARVVRHPGRRAQRALPRATARAARRSPPAPRRSARRSPPQLARVHARGLGAARAPRLPGTRCAPPGCSRHAERLAERAKLTARRVVRPRRSLERRERRPVKPFGFLVGKLASARPGTPRVAEAFLEVPSGEGVVRKLGQVGPESSPCSASIVVTAIL